MWDPTDDTVKLLPSASLAPITAAPTATPETVGVIASVARINDAITRNILLAPLDAPVTPLPHQNVALTQAMQRVPVRLLLADEVGLGKTIEAGLILRELKLRGLARRILVVAPKGLVGQWVAEMDTHFREAFELILPAEIAARRQAAGDAAVWRHFDQVVTSMDSVKPLASREGWSAPQIARHNRDRFEALVRAGWDLIIVDEAHRLAGATDDVARYTLGRGLAEAAPHVLFLSATPHSGKADAFYRLMALLDERAFPTAATVVRDRVLPYVVRTEKRAACDIDGRPLFQPRVTRLIAVAWDARHGREALLYDAVTDYVREGYNVAVRERRYAAGFLLILFQRLVTSSTSAVRAALESRLSVLGGDAVSPIDDAQATDDDATIDQLVRYTLALNAGERREVHHLLTLARDVEAAGPDAKAQRVLDLLIALEREELDPALKLLIFTEFRATQAMLEAFFSHRGYRVAVLNGSMDIDERRRVQQNFAGSTRLLISTEAGGEGLNLQFCHLVVNYDLPWNPMRIEQRIGRVDRIGQTRPVRAYNLTLEASVEYRLQEVLERKLRTIFDALGVDKLGDVLDSGDVEVDFDHLNVEALLHPDRLESEAEALAEVIQRRAGSAATGAALLTPQTPPDLASIRVATDHSVRQWIETLTLAAVRDEGGSAVRRMRGDDLTWADGEAWSGAVFSRDHADLPETRLVTLAEPKLQALLRRGRRHVPGQPIARMAVSGLPAGVTGVWSLWELTARAGPRGYRRVMALFLHDNGALLVPSARRIWNALVQPDTVIEERGLLEPSTFIPERLREAADAEAAQRYEEIAAEHAAWLKRERDALGAGFAARRRLAETVGLATVRQCRLDLLTAEERRAEAALRDAAQPLTDLAALLLLHVVPLGG